MIRVPPPDRDRPVPAPVAVLPQLVGEQDAARVPQPAAAAHAPVRIRMGALDMEGNLSLPPAPQGLVILAIDGASGRYCPRNLFVANVFNERGIATLLVDLLTPQEDAARSPRFDLELLQRRLNAVIAWTGTDASVRDLPIGLYGANTVAAAALHLAGSGPRPISAVLSRGGRPDLAGKPALLQVRTPVLLIVGGSDWELMEENRAARELMGAWASMRVLPEAGHLFVETGALAQVASMAADFFCDNFRGGPSAGTTPAAKPVPVNPK